MAKRSSLLRYSDSIYLLKQLIEHFSCDGRRGYWVLRVSVDLEHIGHYDESLLVAESGLLDPWVRAGSRLALQRRVIRLGKPPRRWKTPSFAMSVNRNINEVVTFVHYACQNCKSNFPPFARYLYLPPSHSVLLLWQTT